MGMAESRTAGVGVDGVGHQLLGVGQLHDVALVDDGDAVRDVPHYGQVMGDEEVGDAALLAGGGAAGSGTCARMDISSAEMGSIRDDEFGSTIRGAGNADALALAAAELVRVTVQKSLPVHQQPASIPARGGWFRLWFCIHDRFPSGSAMISRTFMRGSRLAYGSWKTICIRRRRGGQILLHPSWR